MTIKRIIRYLLVAVLLCTTIATIAQTQPKVPVTSSIEQSFDSIGANQILDKITIKLSTENVNENHLKEAVDTLTKLRKDAQACVAQTQSEIDKLQAQLDEIKKIEATTEKGTAEQQYLKKKQEQFIDQQSPCTLFVLRSTEAITALNTTIQKRATTELFRVEPTLWRNLVLFVKDPLASWNAYSFQILKDNSGIATLTTVSLLILYTILIIFLFLALRLRRVIKRHIEDKAPSNAEEIPETLVKRFTLPFLCVLRDYLVIFALLAPISAYLLIVTYGIQTFIEILGYSAVGYAVTSSLIKLFFSPPPPAVGVAMLNPEIMKRLSKRLLALNRIVFPGLILYGLNLGQSLPQPAINIMLTLFTTLVSIYLISIVWVVNLAPRLQQTSPVLRISLGILFSLALFIILTSEWLGYHNVSFYLIRGIALSLVSFFVAWFFSKIGNEFIQSLDSDQHHWQQQLKHYLGLKRSTPIPELIWLRLIITLSVWGGLILALLNVWGLSKAQFDILISSMVDGFKIADIKIIPLHVIVALFIFSILSTLTRLVRSYVTRRQDLRLDRGAQDAIASIIGYIGFGLTLILSLLIAGINLQGLAIIAGALSLGIGIGLQNVTNNFVSGLILLFERPIRVGDMITVGNAEGYVRKISIRSTRIETFNHSDIIVPNAELISEQVTNLMFRDPYGRLQVKIGVAYGSDVQLVKKLLLQIAEANEGVLVDEHWPLPSVVFSDFGDSTLNFELRCLIRNIDRRTAVRSAINFEIEKAFRENNIEIAFPQRDIYIKSLPDIRIRKSDQE